MTAKIQLTSFLGPTIAQFLALKRALGCRCVEEAKVLAHLDRFLAAETPATAALTADRFGAWTLTFGHLTPTVRRNWMRIARNLCLYLRRSDPECFVPDPSGFPAPHVRAPPHIFSEEQILHSLRAAADVQVRPNSPIGAAVFRLAIVLLYTAGLRRGEVVREQGHDNRGVSPIAVITFGHGDSETPSASLIRIDRGGPLLPARSKAEGGPQCRMGWSRTRGCT